MKEPRITVALCLLLILHPLIGSQATTASLVVVFFWALIRLHFKLPRRALLLTAVPIVIILLGLLESPSHNARDILKDGWYSGFPVLCVLAGYVLTHSSRRIEWCLLAFVLSGFALSAWHLAQFAAHRDLLTSGDLGGLRDEIGGGYMLSAVSPLIMFLSRHFGIMLPGIERRIVRYPIYCVTLSAVAFSFSRTLMIAMIMALLAGLGWLTARNKRGIIVVGCLIILLFCASNFIPQSSSSFLGKFARTRDELTFSNFATPSDATRYWRAYETLIALRTYFGGSNLQKAVGLGFGQLVDIGMEVQLGDSFMSQIPIFHNGYVYVLLKTGYVGFALFLIYLGLLYKMGARQFGAEDPWSRALGGLLMAMISIIVVGTFVVSGWFNPDLMCGVLVLTGCLLAGIRRLEVARSALGTGI